MDFSAPFVLSSRGEALLAPIARRNLPQLCSIRAAWNLKSKHAGTCADLSDVLRCWRKLFLTFRHHCMSTLLSRASRLSPFIVQYKFYSRTRLRHRWVLRKIRTMGCEALIYVANLHLYIGGCTRLQSVKKFDFHDHKITHNTQLLLQPKSLQRAFISA